MFFLLVSETRIARCSKATLRSVTKTQCRYISYPPMPLFWDREKISVLLWIQLLTRILDLFLSESLPLLIYKGGERGYFFWQVVGILLKKERKQQDTSISTGRKYYNRILLLLPEEKKYNKEDTSIVYTYNRIKRILLLLLQVESITTGFFYCRINNIVYL